MFRRATPVARGRWPARSAHAVGLRSPDAGYETGSSARGSSELELIDVVLRERERRPEDHLVAIDFHCPQPARGQRRHT